MFYLNSRIKEDEIGRHVSLGRLYEINVSLQHPPSLLPATWIIFHAHDLKKMFPARVSTWYSFVLF